MSTTNKMKSIDNVNLADFLQLCHWIHQRGWSPATGGNFSYRLTEQQACITQSGKDKGQLTQSDLMIIDAQAQAIDPPSAHPSAEALLHAKIYAHCPQAQVILHTHSVAATVLSMQCHNQALRFEGYEMQKTIQGIESHLSPLVIPVLDNDQDMHLLSQAFIDQLPACQISHSFLVQGHGLYVWGADVSSAKRHLEGLEFLFQCEQQRRQMETR